MTYHEQMEQCSVAIMLEAVVRAEGNQIRAAESLRIHRNTLSRELRKNGWDTMRLRKYTEENNPVFVAKKELKRRARIDVQLLKKPVMSVGLAIMLNGSTAAIRRWTA